MGWGLLFSLLRGRRRGVALLGWLLSSGLGAALLNTIGQHFQGSREKRQAGPQSDVEEALGEERIQWLMKKTGMTRVELLAGLRFSTEEEAGRFARYR